MKLPQIVIGSGYKGDVIGYMGVLVYCDLRIHRIITLLCIFVRILSREVVIRNCRNGYAEHALHAEAQ